MISGHGAFPSASQATTVPFGGQGHDETPVPNPTVRESIDVDESLSQIEESKPTVEGGLGEINRNEDETEAPTAIPVPMPVPPRRKTDKHPAQGDVDDAPWPAVSCDGSGEGLGVWVPLSPCWSEESSDRDTSCHRLTRKG